MSAQGIPAAIILILSSIAFVGLMVGLDAWFRKRRGDAGTMTFGIRYLIAHVPLLTLSLAFLLGCLVGGLLVHFAAVPSLFWP